jgi:carbonic anhydrase
MTTIDTTTIDTLISRNDDFAAYQFSAGLRMAPSLRTMIISCVDPRVDPAHVLGLRLGEAVVIRNIGGRITPATLQSMAMLRMIAQADGGSPGNGWNLVVLQHTDCGMTRLVGSPDLLAEHFGIAKDQLDAKAVADPYAAVKGDVAALKANPFLPGGFIVSGLVYDIATGRLDQVVAPALLREE